MVKIGIHAQRSVSWRGQVSRVALVVTAAFHLSAQGVPVLQRGDFELGGFGFSSFGSTLGGLYAQSTSPGMAPFSIVTPSSNVGAGVQAAGAISARIWYYVEWSYIAGGHIDFNQDYILASSNPTTNQQSLSAKSSSWDAGGGLQVLLPLKREPHVIPYLQVGAAVLGTHAGFGSAVIGAPVGQPFSDSGSVSRYGPVVNTGCGVRYFFTERAGLRMELGGSFGPEQSVPSIGTSTIGVSHNSVRFGKFAFGFIYRLH